MSEDNKDSDIEYAKDLIAKITDLLTAANKYSISEAKGLIQYLSNIGNDLPGLASTIADLSSKVDSAEKELNEKEQKEIEAEKLVMAKMAAEEEKREDLKKAEENREREQKIKEDLVDYYRLNAEIEKNDQKISEIIKNARENGRKLNEEERDFIKDNHSKFLENIERGSSIKEDMDKSIAYHREQSNKLTEKMQIPGSDQKLLQEEINRHNKEEAELKENRKSVDSIAIAKMDQELSVVESFVEMEEDQLAKDLMIEYMKKIQGKSSNSQIKDHEKDLIKKLGITEDDLSSRQDINKNMKKNENKTPENLQNEARRVGKQNHLQNHKDATKKDTNRSHTTENLKKKANKKDKGDYFTQVVKEEKRIVKEQQIPKNEVLGYLCEKFKEEAENFVSAVYGAVTGLVNHKTTKPLRGGSPSIGNLTPEIGVATDRGDDGHGRG